MGVSDRTLFGLAAAEGMAEDARETDIAFSVPLRSKAAVRNDVEAAEYTAEIMAGLPRCGCCGRYYIGDSGSPLCENCQRYAG